MEMPRVIIAGTHSGCGKTTVATGLMAALAARGYKVQPFKVGPDFIDPTHHTAICGRRSRNLDPFMMGERGTLETFEKASAGADIAIVEGVMGLYDGVDGTEIASTAQVAKLLSAPVLLVVNVKGMSRSAGAILKGFKSFDTGVNIGGVIFNMVGSARHREMVERTAEASALGWILKNTELEVTSRHLGLKMADEASVGYKARHAIEEHCDLDGITSVARSAPKLPEAPLHAENASASRNVTIGVANDPAFCFYYADNLDRLKEAGAELAYFSPVDDRLPPVDGLYFGGGYPELHADALESSGCREAIRRAIDDGMPVYAECGGLMYLTESITINEKAYAMVNALPGRSEMTGRMQALGYVNAKATGSGPIAPGLELKGHEFHYSKTECSNDARFAFELSRGKGILQGLDGLYVHNAVGAYTHAYFSSEFAGSLVCSMKKYARS